MLDVRCPFLASLPSGSGRCPQRRGPGDFTGLTLDSKGISEGNIKPVDERVEQWLSSSIQMKRELKPEEHEEIVKAIAEGDRVKATSLYLSATEGDLTTAQNFIKTLILEKQAAQSQQSAKEGG